MKHLPFLLAHGHGAAAASAGLIILLVMLGVLALIAIEWNARSPRP